MNIDDITGLIKLESTEKLYVYPFNPFLTH